MQPIVRNEGFFVNPGKIPFGLLGSHRAADIEEMCEHGLLAVGAEAGTFGEGLVEFGRHFSRAGDEAAHTFIVFVDAAAHFLTVRKIAAMKLFELLELGRAELELALKPGEFGSIGLKHVAMGGGAEEIKTAKREHGDDDAENQRASELSFHGRGS